MFRKFNKCPFLFRNQLFELKIDEICSLHSWYISNFKKLVIRSQITITTTAAATTTILIIIITITTTTTATAITIKSSSSSS